jgi:hypothetical protein
MSGAHISVGKPEGKRSLGRPRYRWEDIMKMDIRKYGLRVWVGFIWLRIVTGGRLLRTNNEPSAFIKVWEFFDYLSVPLASQQGLCFVK